MIFASFLYKVVGNEQLSWVIDYEQFIYAGKNLKICVLGYKHTATNTVCGCNMSQAQVRE